jgi:putative ABC transport system permease protein
MRKNGKFYLPYLLTCIGAASMFYIMLFLEGNEGLQAMPGREI